MREMQQVQAYAGTANEQKHIYEHSCCNAKLGAPPQARGDGGQLVAEHSHASCGGVAQHHTNQDQLYLHTNKRQEEQGRAEQVHLCMHRQSTILDKHMMHTSALRKHWPQCMQTEANIT